MVRGLMNYKARFSTTLSARVCQIWLCRLACANNGILFSESAKGLILVNSVRNAIFPPTVPQNITGFMVGRQCENEGIAKMAPNWSWLLQPPNVQNSPL